MKIEIDQSGKIGDTKVPTVLAFSNSINYTIFVPATVKRKCILELRRRGLSEPNTYLQLFTVGIYLLLHRHIKKVKQAVIDIEYFGKEAVTKEHLLNLFRRQGAQVDPDKIEFNYIGKKSPAHYLALQTFRKKLKSNLIITPGDLLTEFRQ